MTIAYVDTSALAKRFLGEAGREEFNAWYARLRPVWTSELARLELDSLLARLRAQAALDAPGSDAIDNAMAAEAGIWFLTADLLPADIASARQLVRRYGGIGLRSLDALHLATALRLRASELATADRALARAAEAAGVSVIWFGT